ncbi:MAG: DUF4062 domain-containing protein [Butyrivibrio sp.]|uniref:DUF4062 domain-containing protein n=1 Tax=Butyrivibrio sp. TaxID=28121 RepID=UPI001B559B46|nr:DUF4062 domain-containing protein [Butyrivibrio sp.]MBP3783815.1 DUF4062 domain-containing protein [Butyrivibrio sp.]
MRQFKEIKRYEVFVSSTYLDLKKERNIVIKAILDMGYFPTGMEEFPATDQKQFDYIKRVIDTADYYILILGGHSGSFYDKEKGISYTRMEYNYAIKKNIPVIVFVKTDESGEPFVDKSDPFAMKAYCDFLCEVQNNRMRHSFAIAEELAGLVLQSLSEEVRVHPRSGWIRDYKPDFNYEKLLLRGRLLFYLFIDKNIYEQDYKATSVDLGYGTINVCYGKGSQGVFLLVCSHDGNTGHNFYYDIDSLGCFDEEGVLKENYYVQLSFAKLGNIEETLLFLSVGDGRSDMITKVFRIDRYDYKMIGEISGQEFMSVDYTLNVPYGSQGLYDIYVYCEGEMMRADSLE